MIRAGVDAGSVNTKVLFFDAGAGRVLGEAVEPTGLRPRETARRVFNACLARAGLERGQLAEVVATGYARHSVEFATGSMTEIRAAARGVKHWHPGCRTVVDVGGQDSKVISLEDSRVGEFAMNDRCAAGTGNFLSVLARALDVPLDRFGELSRTSRRPAPISSLCVVMAESEILSLAAAEVPVADIVAGLHEALARRVANLAARLLERALGVPVTVAREPLYAAALGAVLG
jgi:predicted CoA-substrate-specific enzyme activase